MDRRLSCALYGWHQEVALHCLRMIVGGVFGRHPRMQIILRHLGEGLPFLRWRYGDDLARITEGRLEKPGAAALS